MLAITRYPGQPIRIGDFTVNVTEFTNEVFYFDLASDEGLSGGKLPSNRFFAISEDIRIKFCKYKGQQFRMYIDAPRSIRIERVENEGTAS